MIVEVTGTGFSNKGAELMLAAIVERMTQTIPEAKFAIDPRMGPYELRARYGLLQKFDATNSGRLGWLRERLFHEGYRRRYGLVAERDITAVLDASGFAFGDIMLEPHAAARARAFKRWRQHGKKVVLLPQAFGPFERKTTRGMFKDILECSDLVFARDHESIQYLGNLVPDHAGLRQTGDFTNLVEGSRPEDLNSVDRMAAITPSAMMMRHGSDTARQSYVPFLARCIDLLHSARIKPFILLHETENDRDLCDELQHRAKCELEIVEYYDPLRLKGRIGGCWVTIGSRFHGLVSALSQGVPSIGTSWSHKYRALFSDYERCNWLVDPAEGPDAGLETLSAMIQNREAEHAHLLDCSKRLKNDAVRMWAEVEEMLRNSTR